MDGLKDDQKRRNNIEKKTQEVVDKMKNIYKNKIRPLEEQFKFGEFHTPYLIDTDFDAKPVVLLIGQYSTGKTSFIRYLLERDFPGANIGPEPTTDRFTAVMYGPRDRIIPGNALATDQSRPFTATVRFGEGFLNRFEASICNSSILRDLTFIDTPGLLSGEKQRIERSYNFSVVTEWFAERSDRILLLFDAYKLDISDEFKHIIKMLRGNDDKIRCILNKSDMPKAELLRVYGALMWSLGKIIQTPEVFRIYIGSFWSQSIEHTDCGKMIKSEMRELMTDLRNLSQNSCLHRINLLVKRTRFCKVHAHLISHLRDQFGWFYKQYTQGTLLKNLRQEMKIVLARTGLPKGDFPNITLFRNQLSRYKIWEFPRLNSKAIENMDIVLKTDIPHLLEDLEAITNDNEAIYSDDYNTVPINPFSEDVKFGLIDTPWIIDRGRKAKYDNHFEKLPLTIGQRLAETDAVDVLKKTGLPVNTLRHIWKLADIDQDGMFDCDEFSVAMFLVDQHKAGKLDSFPQELNPEWVPPSKRHLYECIEEYDDDEGKR